MRLVFLGAPGAGKGTQAAKVVDEFGLVHVATGDLLRAEVAAKSELGVKARAFMDAGRLVPDDLVVSMLTARVAEDDCKSGFLLDGFPRTLPQAEELDRALVDHPVTRSLFFEVSDEQIVGRITGRRTCSECGAAYHVSAHPPKVEGVCDRCGKALIQRQDDREELVKERLAIFRDQTSAVVRYYKDKNMVTTIDADRSVEAISVEVHEILRGLA